MKNLQFVFAGLLSLLAFNAQAQYLPVGPQQNVPVATVEGGGWTECYRATYNVAVHGEELDRVLAICGTSNRNLMMACGATGGDTLQVLAQAPAEDITFDTGTGNTPHNANGSGWYFNDDWSWGFALEGDPLSRGECDTNGTNPDTRMCLHTVDAGGWRCGADTSLNGSTAFEKVIYTDGPLGEYRGDLPVPALNIWGIFLLASLFLAGMVIARRRGILG